MIGEMMDPLALLQSFVELEATRQARNIELIASENYASATVMQLQGSILTNKYAEGYPDKRYYGGCEHVDQIERLAIESAKSLFHVQYANVQPHSGSSANMAAYRVLLKPGDKVLGLALDHGGHLTHGHRMSFSGVDYQFIPYYLNKETEWMDYDHIREVAKEHRPALIVTGTSAYSNEIDFAEFRKIADEVGAKLMVDMAHISGLVAGGVHMNPCDYADIVTSTTHKTLRGPRGGIILTNNPEIAKAVDKMVFPGIQGGPLMHVIGAKAACFIEASQPRFKTYQQQILKNAAAMADEFTKLGYRIISGGTQTHLFTVDVKAKTGINGKVAEQILDSIHITVNKNTIPYDPEPPFVTSGIRIGTAAITTRGFNEKDCRQVARWIVKGLEQSKDVDALREIRHEIAEMIKSHPIPTLA
jgi:glycine hydroxymethyltransferase